MKKIAYIIPGFKESYLTKKGYEKVGEFFKERGIEPIQIDINWEYQNPGRFRDFLAQFLKQYKRRKDAEIYLLGFSFGAVIAFLAEQKIKPRVLILCSLSPYFEEDLSKARPRWVKWFEKNMVDSTYSFSKIAT